MGQKGQTHLWPNLRAEFERDLSVLVEKNGTIDLVFFTGDLVQSGQRAQFDELEKCLQQLWGVFTRTGSSPKLITVPGNHDLRRPGLYKAPSLALSSWNNQPLIRESFWGDARGGLRKQVTKWFAEYTNWLDNTKIPLLEVNRGYLPGDISGTFEKQGVKVGILGLNTTFLQFGPGDLERKLVCCTEQIHEACPHDYTKWIDEHHLSILLTHHPSSWLTEEANAEFYREIFPPGRFRWHLCGHLHEAETSKFSTGGAEVRRCHQGASLFGLEFVGDQKKQRRIHGYLFGSWLFTNSIVSESLFPRIAIEKSSKELRLEPDLKQTLDANQAMVESFQIKVFHEDLTTESQEMAPQSEEWADIEKKLSIDSDEMHRRLSRPLRFTTPSQASYQAIRLDERQAVTGALVEHRKVWIVADWGLGKDGFLATVTIPSDSEFAHDFKFEERLFHFRCDSLNKSSELEDGLRAQLGQSVQEFLEAVSVSGPACIILDGIQPTLAVDHEFNDLLKQINLWIEHAANLFVIVVSRGVPGNGIKRIDLRPLDLPDLRSYIERHPHCQPDLLAVEPLERIFQSSGGVIVHVDRILDQLRVASLNAVLDEEMSLDEIAATEQSLHQALVKAIAAVRKTDSESGSRAFKLLVSLSLLTNGETIEQVKRFLPAQPFYLRDAELLDRNSLVDIIALSSVYTSLVYDSKTLASGVAGPKILRVPRQVRDCVMSLITDEEKQEFIDAAADFYFGTAWRTGRKPKLRKMPAEYRDYIANGVGNEYGIVQMLIGSTGGENSLHSLRAAVKLGTHYCGVLRSAARHQDLRVASRGLIRILEGCSLNSELGQLHKLAGEACRMTDHCEEAIEHYGCALDLTVGTDGDESRARTLLELCICLENLNRIEEAEDAARKALALAHPKSSIESEAKAKLLDFQPASAERDRLLLENERTARDNGWITHANNLALTRAYTTEDDMDACTILDAVLSSQGGGWNSHRAIIEKATRVIKIGDFSLLSGRDIKNLQVAYAFCHSQRLALFNSCHRALWKIMEQQNRLDVLYKLFKHGSFIWQLRGERDIELRYYNRLQDLEKSGRSNRLSSAAEMLYFARRGAVLVLRLVTKK